MADMTPTRQPMPVQPPQERRGYFREVALGYTPEQAVKEALPANPELEILETTRQGEWVSITARKK